MQNTTRRLCMAALILLVVLCLIKLLPAVVPGSQYTKYSADFYEVFNTHTMVIGYAKNETEFQNYVQIIYDEMLRMHQLFDIYNDYDGMNNLKTINDNAGVRPVEVEPVILDMLKLSKQAYTDTDGAVNIAMGAVLELWHDYRTKGLEAPGQAELPPMDALRKAAQHTNIDDLVIDEEKGTVFLRDPEMSLDVGAVAKGYGVEAATRRAEAAGFISGLISGGGNVSVIGKPMDDRDWWGVGIQDPVFTADGSQPLYDTVYLTDSAVVTSGDYQRFYLVGGKFYNHIIDSETLMPANRMHAVTVIHPDSGMADILSTAVFILPYEQGRALVERHGAQAIWIFNDYSSQATDGYQAISQNYGYDPTVTD